MNIGENLIFWRKKNKYTQIKLAAITGITERMYRRYELCETPPTANILIKLADLYNISLDELVGRKM